MKMQVRQAYQQYLYSDRFYKLVHENLDGKRIVNDNLSAYVGSDIFLYENFEDDRTRREDFLALTHYKPIPITSGKENERKKPILKVDISNINIKMKFLGLDNGG